ncbi:DUF3068 domain-containing protein [Corynebacterium sp. zg254]|uniref:DUF3068 domain-containing protein n=1 Tax=Corynebacterium zhongnanshanii TaxID=2768834 RepID=A0ABQ6VG78_9CORY|nr:MULTISPECIES: DUF3068 domain-containing protein [Corynebacterium]KAB3522813.1 DUF3068 domain-containing protein [Corynebacterium zhongnanshanii]MCR5914121.1 DUF3068 domain-containing protein [Corynebacterium sp. zg254]
MRSKLYPIAIVTLIIGVALLTAGYLLPQKVTEEKPLPLQLATSTLTLEDDEASVGSAYPATGGKTIKAPVIKQYDMTLGQPASEDSAAAKVGVSVARGDIDEDEKALLNAQIWSFTVDRFTGEVRGQAKVSDTPATPPTAVENMGQWVKFPQEVEQRDYEYFDDQVRKPVKAAYQGTVTHQDQAGKDVELYVFKQEIPDTDVSSQYDSLWNTQMLRKDGSDERVEGHLTYSGTRTITVEPRSGMIVALDENLNARYLDDQGEKLDDLLVFNGRTTEKVEHDMLAQAQKLGEFRHTSSWGFGLTGLGAIVTAASLIALVVYRRRP